jgi:uncharacterized protein (DUF1015 family)
MPPATAADDRVTPLSAAVVAAVGDDDEPQAAEAHARKIAMNRTQWRTVAAALQTSAHVRSPRSHIRVTALPSNCHGIVTSSEDSALSGRQRTRSYNLSPVATIHPFRALRPQSNDAARVAAVPYDVVSTDEARALADGNPLSFLRVSRAEIELEPGTNPYDEQVYERAARNFDALRKSILVVDGEPSVYVYQLRLGDRTQTGVAACVSLDEYDRDIIRKHERTRPDKENDRTRHMLALGAQTGPVFLTYRAAGHIDALVSRVTSGEPIADFTAVDGVRHTIWRADGVERGAMVSAFRRVPLLYIADGHHRAASAARARTALREQQPAAPADAEFATMLAVAFPHDQVHILPYNRIVKDLGALTPDAFLAAVRERFDVDPGPATPARRGELAMYFQGAWHRLRPRTKPDPNDAIGSLDVSVLQDQLLAPVLQIADVRTDRRIDFIGGARGTVELERLVDAGKAAVAFSLYPVSVDDLMRVSDAGEIMPPKSTWFEPKLRDGLLIHLI